MTKSASGNAKAKGASSGRGQFIGVRIQPELLTKLDDFRRNQHDIPTRPEAMRRLIEQALSARKPK